jgi:putative heme transporter
VRLRSRIWSGVTGWRAVLSRPDVAPPPAGFASGTGGADPVEPTAGPATDNFDRAVPPALQIAASWAWRVILVGALIYLLGRVAGYLSEVVVPVSVAILLAAMLSPVANRLRGWGLHRGPATAATVLGGLILIVGALALIGTQIVSQAAELSTNVVTGFDNLLAALQNSRLPLSPAFFSADQWGERVQTFLTESQSTIASYAAEIGTRVGHFLAGFAITLFSLFYFLYDGRGIFSSLLRVLPRESRARVDHAASNGWRALSGYVRATILVALSDATGVLIAALILGVPVAPALAALVFIGAFVPLVGAFVSGFVAVVVALVALGWVQALIMLGAIILVMQIEGHILQPFLLGRAVKLHPLAVLLAIAVGIIVAGIFGALMAVPLLAFTKSFLQYLHGHPLPPTGEGWRRLGARWADPGRSAPAVGPAVPSVAAPALPVDEPGPAPVPGPAVPFETPQDNGRPDDGGEPHEPPADPVADPQPAGDDHTGSTAVESPATRGS